MEVLRRTPWSRIREQNSVDKGLLEIVGNGKPAGSVLKETMAVSGTIWISVQNRHSRILLRDLLRSRMSENHREPEVQEESPSGGMSRWPCKDYLKGTCTNSSCEKWHPPECSFYKSESGCLYGEKCSYAHRQVDEQTSKRSKKNDDKSAVAILKKGDWQERESVTDECHDRSGKLGKRSDKKLGQKSSQRRSSNARQLGCVFHTWRRRSLFSGRARTCGSRSNVWSSQRLLRVTLKFETQILRSDIFAQVNLISVAPTLQNLRIGLRRRQSDKSKVPAKQRGSWPRVY